MFAGGHRIKFRPAALKARKIQPENRVLPHAVVQAPQVGVKLRRPNFWEPINHPISVAPRLHELALAQVCQMLRNLHLTLS
jgi:hypothetical protein